MREVGSVETEYRGIKFRSRTEARWAVFFTGLGITFQYEPTLITLSNGERYLPDFFLKEFSAWFEVKPDNDNVVNEEASKARLLAADRPGERVWLAVGPPNENAGNILTLDQWALGTPISEILSTSENRYRFLEDRRDEDVFWLQADFVGGESFKRCFVVGGPGISTDHSRLPMLHRRVLQAYQDARDYRWT